MYEGTIHTLRRYIQIHLYSKRTHELLHVKVYIHFSVLFLKNFFVFWFWFDSHGNNTTVSIYMQFKLLPHSRKLYAFICQRIVEIVSISSDDKCLLVDEITGFSRILIYYFIGFVSHCYCNAI